MTSSGYSPLKKKTHPVISHSCSAHFILTFWDLGILLGASQDQTHEQLQVLCWNGSGRSGFPKHCSDIAKAPSKGLVYKAISGACTHGNRSQPNSSNRSNPPSSPHVIDRRLKGSSLQTQKLNHSGDSF